MTSKQAGDQEFDPKYEWQENAANFVLRVHLSGFRKEDFRVQVDGAGRLTVRGQRADGGKHVRFHKVFQLPSTSNLDDISGRFDAGVLALTVPKRPGPPATIDGIPRKPKEEKVQGKEEEAAADEKKIKEEMEDKKQEQMKAEVEAKRSKAEQEQKKIAAAAEHEQIKEAKRSRAEQEQKTAPVMKEEGKPKLVGGPTETKAVDRESLLERVRRRAEEEKAKEAPEEEKKPSTCGGGWKEELQGLTKSEWAEGVVETVKKNKELIAAAVAAFSLGLFVSSRLFSRN